MIIPKWVIEYSSLLKEYYDEFPNEEFNILYKLESPCWALFEENGINHIILNNQNCEDLLDYLLIDIPKLLNNYLKKRVRSVPKNVWYKKYLIGVQFATIDGIFNSKRFNETLKYGNEHLEWIKWTLLHNNDNDKLFNEFTWYYALKGRLLNYLIHNTHFRPSSNVMDYLYNYHKEQYFYIMNFYKKQKL